MRKLLCGFLAKFLEHSEPIQIIRANVLISKYFLKKTRTGEIAEQAAGLKFGGFWNSEIETEIPNFTSHSS